MTLTSNPQFGEVQYTFDTDSDDQRLMMEADNENEDEVEVDKKAQNFCQVAECGTQRRIIGECSKAICFRGRCKRAFCAEHDGRHILTQV